MFRHRMKTIDLIVFWTLLVGIAATCAPAAAGTVWNYPEQNGCSTHGCVTRPMAPRNLTLDVLMPTPRPGDPVSLLASKRSALPHPGYGVSQDVTVDGQNIFVELTPTPPRPDWLWSQVVVDLNTMITVENLTAGLYTVDATWHSVWSSEAPETASASFTVVPEPSTFGLVVSALILGIALLCPFQRFSVFRGPMSSSP